MTAPLRGVCIGAGYFSQFHFEAWKRIPQSQITAVCDCDPARAGEAARAHGIARHYADCREMLDVERPDFLDIITPPETHLDLCRLAAERGIAVICQKPLAPSFEEAA